MRLRTFARDTKRKRGFTLIELLVAAVLAGAIVALVYALYVAYSRTILEQRQRWVEIEQVARATVDRLKQYINYMGKDVKFEGGQPIVVYAAPYELGFNADVDEGVGEIGSGVVTFSSGYVYDPGTLFGGGAETYRIFFPATPTIDYSLSPLDKEMRVQVNASANTYQLSYGVRFDDGSDTYNPDGKRPAPLFTYWGDWDFDAVTPDTLWGDTNGDGYLDQSETRTLLTDSHKGAIVFAGAIGNCSGKTIYNTEDKNCNGQWDTTETDLNHNGRLDTDLLATQLHRVDVNVTVISRTKTSRTTVSAFREAKAGLSVYPKNLLSTVLVRSCGNPPTWGSPDLTASEDKCGGVHVLFNAAEDDGKNEDDIVYYKVMRCNLRAPGGCTGEPETNPNWRAVAVIPAEGKWRYHTGAGAPQYEYFDTDLEYEYIDQEGTGIIYRFEYRVYVYDCAGQSAIAGSIQAQSTPPVQEAMKWFSENYMMWAETTPCNRFDGSGTTFGSMALFWPAIYEVPGGIISPDEEALVEYWVYKSVDFPDYATYGSATDDELFATLALEDPIAKLKPRNCGAGGCPPASGDAEEVFKDYAFYKFHHTAWRDSDWYMWRDKVDSQGRTGLDFSVLPQNGKIFGVGETFDKPTRQYIYWLRVYDTHTGCLSKPIKFRSTFEKANPRGTADKYRFGDTQTFYTQTEGCDTASPDSRFAPPRWLAPIWTLGQGSDSYVDPLDPSIIEASEVGDPIIPGFQVSWYPSKSENTTRCPVGICSFNDVVEYYVVREEWNMNVDHSVNSYVSGSRVWIGPITARATYQPDAMYKIRDREDMYGETEDTGEFKAYYYMWLSKDATGEAPGEAGLFAPDFASPICAAPNCAVPDQYKLKWDPDWTDENGNFIQPYLGYYYYIVGVYRHSTTQPTPPTPQPTDNLSVGVTAPNRAWWNCSHEVGNLDPSYTYFKHCDLTDYLLVSYAWTNDSELAANPGNYEMKLQFRDITENDPAAPWQDVTCLPSTIWPLGVDVCGTNSSGDRACICRHAPFWGSDIYGIAACDPNNPGGPDPSIPDATCASRWMPNRKYDYRVLVWRKDQQSHVECQLAYYVGEEMPGMPGMEAMMFDNKEPWGMQWGIDYSGISPAISPCSPSDPCCDYHDSTDAGEVFFYVWREYDDPSSPAGWQLDTNWRPGTGVFVEDINPFGQECWRPGLQQPYPNYLNDLCAWDLRGVASDRSFSLRDYAPGNLQYGFDYRYCSYVVIDHDGNGPDWHGDFPSWDTWSDMGCVPIPPVFEILFPVCPTSPPDPTNPNSNKCYDSQGNLVLPGDPVPDWYNIDPQGNYKYEKTFDFGDSSAFGSGSKAGFRRLVLPPCCGTVEGCSQLGSNCQINMCGESALFNLTSPEYLRYSPFTSGARNATFYEDAKKWFCPTLAAMSLVFPTSWLCLLIYPEELCNSTKYTCGHQPLWQIMTFTYWGCIFDPGSYWVMDSTSGCENPNWSPPGCHSARQDCAECDPFGLDLCPLLDFLCHWPGCCICPDDCWVSCCGYTFTQCFSAIFDPVNCSCQSTSCCIFPWAISTESGNYAMLGLHSLWMERAMRWLSDLINNDFLDPFDYGEWAGTRYLWNHFGIYSNPLLDDTDRDCASDAPRNPREDLQNFVMVWDQKVWDSGNLGSVDLNNASFVTSFMLQDVNKALGQYMEVPSQYLLVHDFTPSNGQLNFNLQLYFGSPSTYTLEYTLDFDLLIRLGLFGGNWEWRFDIFTIDFFDWVTRVQGWQKVAGSTAMFPNSYDSAWWRNYLLVCRQTESGNEGAGCTSGCNNTHAFAFTAPQGYFGTDDIEKRVLENSMPAQGYAKMYFNSDDKSVSLIYNPDPNWYWENTLIDWYVGWWLYIYVGFPTYLGWIPNSITVWSDRIDRLEKDYLRDGKGRIGFWVEHEMAMARWLSDAIAPMTAVDNVRVRLYYGSCPPQWMITNYFSKGGEGTGPGSKDSPGGAGAVERGQGVVYTPLTALVEEGIPMMKGLKDKDIEDLLFKSGRATPQMVNVEKIEQMKKVIKQQYTVMRRYMPAEAKFEQLPAGFTFGKAPMMLYRDDMSGDFVYAKVLSPQALKSQFMWSQDTIDKFTRRIKEAQLEGKLPFKEINDVLSLIDFPVKINMTLAEPDLIRPEMLGQLFDVMGQRGKMPEEVMALLQQNMDKFEGRVIDIDMSKDGMKGPYNVPFNW